ncbi:MAG: bifunctional hydroxymethylpyrimidine kinase/phosphomethylpyrimidine kinase [Magnetococcales bacterium]|nr:bifunctional hydroxymethylpyrimidine kinase/phosphomethylpyrimidine kinase [Magnetococcales bacterium]
MTSIAMKGPPAGRVLVVAGSDPVAGAGLQADLKSISALGGYALTVITAVTVQDTWRVHEFFPLTPELVTRQMRVVLRDVKVDCIKLGMLGSAAIIAAVTEVLADYPALPVVADPVLVAGGGGSLLGAGGVELVRNCLLPRVTLLTPNVPEAEVLSGLAIDSTAAMESAARRLAAGGTSILLTGGHLPGETIDDLLFDGQACHWFTSPRQAGPGFHGTGCTLASAVAVGLAQGMPLPAAVARALAYVQQAVAGSFELGGGQRVLRHFP